MFSLNRGNLTQVKYAEKIHSGVSPKRGAACLSELFVEKKGALRLIFTQVRSFLCK